MTDEMKKQIKNLAFKGYYRKIVDLILAVPEGDRDSEMNLQLTNAYNESKQYPKAIKALESIQKDCEDQAVLHYQMGYALYYKEKYAQAEEFLSKAASIVTDANFDLKNNIGKLLDKARFQLDYIKRLGDKEEFLPENFPELMREGNLEKLKKFTKNAQSQPISKKMTDGLLHFITIRLARNSISGWLNRDWILMVLTSSDKVL